MNKKLVGLLMMMPFILFMVLSVGIIILDSLNAKLGEVILRLGVIMITGSLVLGSYFLAMEGWERINSND